jgi:hypothetical protein
MLKTKPHRFAAACLYAALLQPLASMPKLKGSVWSKLLQEETGFQEVDLIEPAYLIVKHLI